MSLSGLLSSLIGYTAGVIEHDCPGAPTPDRLFRYHGTAGTPHDCCSESGLVSAEWDRTYASSKWPADDSAHSGACSGIPTSMIAIRYVKCWPVSEDGNAMPDPAVDAAAAQLAEVADCVTRALLDLACDPANGALTKSVLGDNGVGVGLFRFRACEPIPPLGACAGVLWRVVAGVIRAGNAS